MPLGIKTIVLVAVLVVLSILAQFAIIGRGVLPGLEKGERLVAEHSLRQALDSLSASADRLAGRLRDWAEADATLGFLRAPADDYPLADLVYESLLVGDFDLFALYDNDGQILWGALPEGSGPEGAARAEAMDRLLRSGMDQAFLKADRPTGSVVAVDDWALYVAAQPVIDPATGAAAVGRVVMARLLTAAEIERLATRLDTPLEVKVVPQARQADARAAFAAEDYRQLPDEGPMEALQGVVRDPTGLPVLLVQVPAPKELFAPSRKGLHDSLTAVLIVGGTLFFLLLFGFQILVLRPVSSLARAVAGIALKGRGARLQLRRRDEVGVIAREFDALLARSEGTSSRPPPGAPPPRTPPRGPLRKPKKPQDLETDEDDETLRRVRRLLKDDF